MVGKFEALSNRRDARFDWVICRRLNNDSIFQANTINPIVINNRSYIVCPP